MKSSDNHELQPPNDTNNVQKIMEQHGSEHDELKQAMNHLNTKYLPLHQFTTKDIHNTIKSWVFNDIKYNKNLQQTMRILSRRKLDGAKMSILSAEDLKDIVNNELKQFITPKTLIVMFKWFDHWMKTEAKNIIKSKTSEDLGYMLYNCPLNRLLKRINHKQIDGQKLIALYKASKEKQNKNWMEERTGWNEEDIYQIHSVLFRHHTFTSDTIMDKIKSITLTDASSKSVADSIQNTIISHFNLETLHYKIKTGQPVNEFSDMIINMVSDMMHNNNNNNNNNNDDAVFIKQIYEAIARCFACDFKCIQRKSTASKLSSLDLYQDWKCSNCGNYNFVCLAGSIMCDDLSVCTLCGIQHIESIILLLRGSDTYVLVNSIMDKQQKEVSHAAEQDDIDIKIKSALDAQKFDLKCLYRNDNDECPSILRLAKYLIQYKRWIDTVYTKTNGNDSTANTVKVDISTFVTDEIYRNVVITCAQSIDKLTTNDIDQIREIFSNKAHETNPIKRVETFLKSKRLAFAKLISQYVKVKIACGLKLYSRIKYELQKQAQTQEFGKFLSDLDISVMDEDYHHILHAHINNGNKTTIENVFKFFGYVVHYEDTDKQKELCRSVHRREERMNTFDIFQDDDDDHKENNLLQDKNIWTLKQYYMQSQLDIIHSYLVHSNWKYFVQRHVIQHAGDAVDHSAFEHLKEKDYESNMNLQEMQHKYTTDLDESNTKYGFGVDHSHPHLKPIYMCIRDEIVFNKLYSLSTHQFEALLTKAIRTHRIAVRVDDDNRLRFICKYFKREFNIIRNEAISIRHILAIIAYTDISKFCTAYRSTYRQLANESNTFQVSERHRELYYYARCLYESVEFFGQEMDSKLKVYHGLNKVMKFHQFTAYFNQPISTTTSKMTAFQFSQSQGIILTLKSGTEYEQKTSKIPKYLSVSWCSCFPNEDELLYYGENVKFQIYNIIEAQSNQGHLTELSMLNKFQKTVQNQDIEWRENDKKTGKMIDILEWLIMNQQKMNIKTIKDESDEIQEDEDESNKYITSYGKELFSYFCNNSNTTSIGIRNYTKLPPKLRSALFGSQGFSFIPIVNLFRCLTDITLDELDIGQFTTEAVSYFDAVLEYVKECSGAHEIDDLNQIKLYSVAQRDKKENTTLQKLADRYGFAFTKYNWGVHYRAEFNGVHTLMFNKHEQVQKSKFVKRNSKFNLFTNRDYKDPAKFVNPGLIPENILNKWSSTDNLLQMQQDDIWHKTPSLFMQITSVDEDVFHLKLAANDINASNKRCFRIINILEPTAVNVPITIYKKKKYSRIDVDIDAEHGPLYHLAIYDPQHMEEPIANSNKIQFNVLKNENQFPPQNTEYRPHAIDVSTVLKVRDEVHDTIHIYWSLPTASMGKISYKIVDWNADAQQNAESTLVKILPHEISVSCIPASFRVITIVNIDGNIYHSEKSKVIHVEDEIIEEEQQDIELPYLDTTETKEAVSEDTEDTDNDKNTTVEAETSQAASGITQSTTTEAFIDANLDIIEADAQDDEYSDDELTDEDVDSIESITSNDDEDEDEEDDDEDSTDLIESFLKLEDPQINWKMIEFLSKDNMTHAMMHYLSRTPQGPKIWLADLSVDFESRFADIKALSSENTEEIAKTKLSYNLMRMLSNEHAAETVKSYLLRKCQEICLHALAAFHPTSSGNVYHARVVLEILLNHWPKSFMAALVNQKHVKTLLKGALFRNLHQGNLNSFFLDLICFRAPSGAKDAVEGLKSKLISMFKEWKFVEYVLKVGSTNIYANDLIATKYATFFIDLVARSATIQEAAPLFTGCEHFIVDSFVNGLFDDTLTIWQKMSCGQTLIQFLDIASRPTIIDPTSAMAGMLGVTAPEAQANVLHSFFPKILERLHELIPQLCDGIISTKNAPPAIKLSGNTVTQPFGQIKLQCLELLTVAADFAQFKCGDVLANIPNYFWSDIVNIVFIHTENNLFLMHFRRLIHLAMIFRRRILKQLFVNDKLLERFADFYENKAEPRTALHAYILQMLWDIYHNDQRDDEKEEKEVVSDEDDSKEIENEQDDEFTEMDLLIKPNFSDEPEDKWDIISFFDSNKIWKRFSVTVSFQMETQNSTETQVPDVNVANNQDQLDALLANLLGPSNDEDDYSDSDSDSDED